MFTIIPLTFIPSMLLVQYVPKRIDKRVILILSAFCLGISTFFNGPSMLLHMENKLKFIVYGQALSGIFIACLTIPILPEMILASRKRYARKQAQKVNTLASGLFNAALGLG